MTTAVLQALATGLPTVTTNHGAFSEQIIEGKNGFMVDEGDYEALAEKILYMMDHPELWPEFGRYGRKHVEEKFNSKVLIKKQIAIYDQLLEKNPTLDK